MVNNTAPAIGSSSRFITPPMSTSAEPDMSLVGELLEVIDMFPPGIEARRMLMQQHGWQDAARNAAKELLKFEPADKEAASILLLTRNSSEPATSNGQRDAFMHTSVVSPQIQDVGVTTVELVQGLEALRQKAHRLQTELLLLQRLQRQRGMSLLTDGHSKEIDALASGRLSSVLRVRRPNSIKVVARAMETTPENALDIAISDLASQVEWLRLATRSSSDNDAVSEALARRVSTLRLALPESLQPLAATALMHVEHEVLKRIYVCDQTMLGDPIADTPRSHFLVTQDGYCWDMSELASAITSGGGVMRNPLSRQMFTQEDVRSIVQHPLGQRLAALQIEQSKLSQGVRPETIERLEKLAQTLLADMSDDAMASRHAVDEFLAYVSTLPEAEQIAIDKLQVSAKDKHTGLPYDTTIGEAVRDAQGNRVCFHKTGDFIGQAAAHLHK